eukprot:gene3237-3816_t
MAAASPWALLLAAGRFDYFPRALGEAVRESDQFAARGIVAAPGFVLHMRSAVYFFVNKKNHALAAAIEHGLRSAIQDGSFDKLFRELNDTAIERARLAQRQVIELANPELPPETPLADKSLWFVPLPGRPRHAPQQAALAFGLHVALGFGRVLVLVEVAYGHVGAL